MHQKYVWVNLYNFTFIFLNLKKKKKTYIYHLENTTFAKHFLPFFWLFTIIKRNGAMYCFPSGLCPKHSRLSEVPTWPGSGYGGPTRRCFHRSSRRSRPWHRGWWPEHSRPEQRKWAQPWCEASARPDPRWSACSPRRRRLGCGRRATACRSGCNCLCSGKDKRMKMVGINLYTCANSRWEKKNHRETNILQYIHF